MASYTQNGQQNSHGEEKPDALAGRTTVLGLGAAWAERVLRVVEHTIADWNLPVAGKQRQQVGSAVTNMPEPTSVWKRC